MRRLPRLGGRAWLSFVLVDLDLVAPRRALGVFALYSAAARAPTEAETHLVEVVAHIAGIAIERKLAEDRIQFMANHDALTGLPNRALLKDRLTQAAPIAQRYDRWATVAFIDLDNFKFINDSLGHNAGDELLKVVASRMVACVRATDTVVRLGGDEFVVLLFDQPKSAEIDLRDHEKAQAAIAEPISVEGHALRVTSSFGVANYPRRRDGRRDAARQRRRGDVPRQGNRARQFSVLYARNEREGSREIRAPGGTAKRRRSSANSSSTISLRSISAWAECSRSKRWSAGITRRWA